MRRFAWMGVFVLAGLASVSCNDALEGREVFVADLSGSQEVPARPTAASGTAQIIVDGNRISYSIEVDDINSIIQSHIHIGAPGVNGPVRLFLYPAPPATLPAPLISTTEKAILVDATVDAGAVTGVSFADLLAAMRSGNAYVNVHTTQFPGGEIRGVIRPQSVD